MSNSKQPWLIRYSYDPLDKLTSYSLSDTPELHRFYCKNRLATEIQGAIGHSIVQHGDLLLAQQQHENNALDTTLLATDVQRSVLHTLKKNTERQAIAYCPYGHRTAFSGLLSLLGFNGERPDPATGHYLLGNGYRAFNPVLMRFNSPDNWSPFGEGGLNSYSYCLGDPINLSDPNGHGPRLTAFVETLRSIFSKSSKTGKPITSSTKDIITPAATASNTHTFTSAATGTGLFEKLEEYPELMKNIVHQLPATDMIKLAQTSPQMKNLVYSSTRALPDELHGTTKVSRTFMSSGYTIHGTRSIDYIEAGNVQRIGSGVAPGILPVQLPRAGIKVRFSGANINDALGRDFNSGPLTNPYQNYTLRTLT